MCASDKNMLNENIRTCCGYTDWTRTTTALHPPEFFRESFHNDCRLTKDFREIVPLPRYRYRTAIALSIDSYPFHLSHDADMLTCMSAPTPHHKRDVAAVSKHKRLRSPDMSRYHSTSASFIGGPSAEGSPSGCLLVACAGGCTQ